ncbi:MAG: class II aldolase/adducin family protein [Solirubrobacteraceae bacterium]
MAPLPSAHPPLSELREELAATCLELAGEGLVTGTSGNLSCRADEGVLISPTGAELGQLQAGQIPLVDLYGEVIDGQLEPSSEINLHLGMYRRYGAGGVVHTHAPMSAAVGCVVDELPCVHYLMVDLGGTVPVAPYLTFGTQELADAVHEAIEGHTAALMANHGTLAYGDDLATAATRTRLLEWVSTLYWHAAAIGTPRTLTDAEQSDVVAAIEHRPYGSMHRLGAG